MAFFAAVGARIVLSSSPSRHAAGTVNRELLDALDVASYGFSAYLFVSILVLSRREAWPRLRRGLALRLLVVCAAAAFVSHVIITPEMMTLRDLMPAIVDLVPKSDPLRKEWGRLHGLSAFALLLRVLGSAAVFAVVLRSEPGAAAGLVAGPPPPS